MRSVGSRRAAKGQERVERGGEHVRAIPGAEFMGADFHQGLRSRQPGHGPLASGERSVITDTFQELRAAHQANGAIPRPV